MSKWLLAALCGLAMVGCDADGDGYEAIDDPTPSEVKVVAEKEHARIMRLASYARECAFTSYDAHERLVVTGCEPFRRTMRRAPLDLKSLLFRWGVATSERQKAVFRDLCAGEAELCANMELVAATRIRIAALTQRHRADHLVKQDAAVN